MQLLYLHQLLLAINWCVSPSLGSSLFLVFLWLSSLTFLHHSFLLLLLAMAVFSFAVSPRVLKLPCLSCSVVIVKFRAYYFHFITSVILLKTSNDIVLFYDFRSSCIPSNPWFRSISTMLNAYAFGIYSFYFVRHRYVPSSTCLFLAIDLPYNSHWSYI